MKAMLKLISLSYGISQVMNKTSSMISPPRTLPDPLREPLVQHPPNLLIKSSLHIAIFSVIKNYFNSLKFPHQTQVYQQVFHIP
jgi:hypothetical protein